MKDCGHGWVHPHPAKIKARCGGPGMCPQCAEDLNELRNQKIKEALSMAEYRSPSTIYLGPVEPPRPQPVFPPVGCICPPGANAACERPDCPRKNPLKDTFGIPRVG
jgi:hypothetical protein